MFSLDVLQRILGKDYDVELVEYCVVLCLYETADKLDNLSTITSCALYGTMNTV